MCYKKGVLKISQNSQKKKTKKKTHLYQSLFAWGLQVY